MPDLDQILHPTGNQGKPIWPMGPWQGPGSQGGPDAGETVKRILRFLLDASMANGAGGLARGAAGTVGKRAMTGEMVNATLPEGASGYVGDSLHQGASPLAEAAANILQKLGITGNAAGPLGAATAATGAAATGAAGVQTARNLAPPPGADPIQMQMQTLVSAGVPASQAWKVINGDQPLQPNQMATWGAAYAKMGGVNDLPGGPVSGVPPVGPAATPPPAGSGMNPMGEQHGNPTGGTVMDFAALPPDQQAAARAEHGSLPPELGGGAPAPTATPPTPGAGAPPAAAAPAGQPPTVGAAAAGAPGGNVNSPEQNAFMYDLMNPERASQNAIGASGGPTYGPGFDWLKAYLQPAFLQSLAGGDLTPGGLKGSLTSRLGGTSGGSASDTINAMRGFESQGRTAMAGAPGADLRTLMDRAKSGDTTARDQLVSKYGGMGYMSFLGSQDPGQMGGALAQAIAGDTNKPMAPGLAGVLGQFLGQIMTKQVNQGSDTGPNANNRFGYLSSLLGY